jgi:hypothetical protein
MLGIRGAQTATLDVAGTATGVVEFQYSPTLRTSEEFQKLNFHYLLRPRLKYFNSCDPA